MNGVSFDLSIQKTMTVQTKNNNNTNFQKMKKQILSFALVCAMLTTAIVSNAATNNYTKDITPQEKIVKDFNKQFDVTPAISISSNGFIASSVIDGNEVSSAYNKKGNRVYTIVRYTVDGLDKDVLETVKGIYAKCFITSMEKVSQPGFDPVFIVHLLNGNSLKTVKVIGDNTMLLQDLSKI